MANKKTLMAIATFAAFQLGGSNSYAQETSASNLFVPENGKIIEAPLGFLSLCNRNPSDCYSGNLTNDDLVRREVSRRLMAKLYSNIPNNSIVTGKIKKMRKRGASTQIDYKMGNVAQTPTATTITVEANNSQISKANFEISQILSIANVALNSIKAKANHLSYAFLKTNLFDTKEPQTGDLGAYSPAQYASSSINFAANLYSNPPAIQNTNVQYDAAKAVVLRGAVNDNANNNNQFAQANAYYNVAPPQLVTSPYNVSNLANIGAQSTITNPAQGSPIAASNTQQQMQQGQVTTPQIAVAYNSTSVVKAGEPVQYSMNIYSQSPTPYYQAATVLNNQVNSQTTPVTVIAANATPSNYAAQRTIAAPATSAPPLPIAQVASNAPLTSGPMLLQWDNYNQMMLNAINSRVNFEIAPQTDAKQFGVADYWFVPSEEKKKSGDCEDYVLQKRKYLLDAGFKNDDMSIAVVQLKTGEYHAVLIVHTTAGDFSMDNLRPDIYLWNKANYKWISVQSQSNPFNWISVEKLAS